MCEDLPTDDVNECALGTHECDANAICRNTNVSYTCQCKTGFSGDGFECTGKHIYGVFRRSHFAYIRGWDEKWKYIQLNRGYTTKNTKPIIRNVYNSHVKFIYNKIISATVPVRRMNIKKSMDCNQNSNVVSIRRNFTHTKAGSMSISGAWLRIGLYNNDRFRCFFLVFHENFINNKKYYIYNGRDILSKISVTKNALKCLRDPIHQKIRRL